jgi:DNA-directed RNA polymerase specialized sigma24 family protein
VGLADIRHVELDLGAQAVELDAARAEEKTRQILERLPAAYSAALQWRYWEKRTIREMAAQTGKTEKAIERLLARARTTFRRLWEAS